MGKSLKGEGEDKPAYVRLGWWGRAETGLPHWGREMSLLEAK